MTPRFQFTLVTHALDDPTLTTIITVSASNTMLATRPLLTLSSATRSVSRVGLRAALPTSFALRTLPSQRFVSSSSKNPAAAAQTTKLSQQQNLELLNHQRALRPSSPHFTIYQPQITWYLSIINRITGTGLSVCKLPRCAAHSCGEGLRALSVAVHSAWRLRRFPEQDPKY